MTLQRAGSRREFLRDFRNVSLVGGLAVIGGGLLTACGSDGSSGTTGDGGLGAADFQIDWLFDATYAGSLMADHLGLWSEEGLDIKLASGGPQISAESQLATGKVLVSYVTTNLLADVAAQGIDMRIIGNNVSRSPFGIMSAPASPIATPDDLSGKRLGTSVTSIPIVKPFLDLHGLSDSVEIVNTDNSVTALMNNQADAVTCFATKDPATFQVQTGTEAITWLFADFGYNIPVEQYAVRAESLEDAAARAQIVAWMRGELAGWGAVFTDPAGAARVVAGDYGRDQGLDATQVEEAILAAFPLQQSAIARTNGFGWFDDAFVEAAAAGVTLAGSDGDLLRSMYTTEILEEVYSGPDKLAPVVVPDA
jgi:ABC-type nitrate/sulfonate/bicarbonate transport system substrate-binding protein